MKKTLISTLILIIIVVGGFFLFSNSEKEEPRKPKNKDDKISKEESAHIKSKEDLIVLNKPKPNSRISSPIKLEGKARGGWYFEASFPIKIVDEQENLLGENSAQAQGEWMTEKFVPFQSEISFDKPNTKEGKIILEKANPSGLEKNADELRIPIKFNTTSTN